MWCMYSVWCDELKGWKEIPFLAALMCELKIYLTHTHTLTLTFTHNYLILVNVEEHFIMWMCVCMCEEEEKISHLSLSLSLNSTTLLHSIKVSKKVLCNIVYRLINMYLTLSQTFLHNKVK